MKKELIQYLFEASSGDKSFQERFQSFLDQIPKPSGASAAPGKEGFFINFFAGMFASPCHPKETSSHVSWFWLLKVVVLFNSLAIYSIKLILVHLRIIIKVDL